MGDVEEEEMIPPAPPAALAAAACATAAACAAAAEAATTAAALSADAGPLCVSTLTTSALAPLSSPGSQSCKFGKGAPDGSVVIGSLSSSKKGCAIASSGVARSPGAYRSSLATRSTASAGMRFENTLDQGCALICGNLKSV